MGTNLGKKKENLLQAIRLIEERIGRVTSLSSFYETAPWGFESENTFLNAAACVETSQTPFEVLRLTQAIERELGRKEKSVQGTYRDRPIDIDLLLYDYVIINSSSLILPHPLMTKRDFVMRPLTEIAGEAVHPVLKKTLSELYRNMM